MTKILDPLVYGLPRPVRVIRKGESVKVDAFKGIRILETIRVEWGEDWFTTHQLINWLQRKNIDVDMDGIRTPLRKLVVKNFLKREQRLVQGKTKAFARTYYALGNAAKLYLEGYSTFLNPDGGLFRYELKLYQKIKSGPAANW